MKKLNVLICFILSLVVLWGCTGKKEDFEEPVQYYYCNEEIFYNSSSGVIQAETREGAGLHDNLTAFLHSYLHGPESSDLYTLIPSDVYLASCALDGNEVTVVLSAQFAKLSGVELSTACSALLLSVHDYTGADTLRLRAKDSQLDGQDEILLRLDDVVLLDPAQ